MENKNKIPQPEDKIPYKDFTNHRIYTVVHRFNTAFSLRVKIPQNVYLELVKFESKLVGFDSLAPLSVATVTGTSTQNGNGLMSVYDVGAVAMSPNEPFSGAIFDHALNITDAFNLIKNDFYIGDYVMLIKNNQNINIGSFNLPLEEVKIFKPHLFFHNRQTSLLNISISAADMNVSIGTTDNVKLYLYFQFAEYPDLLHYFAQQGRVYI